MIIASGGKSGGWTVDDTAIIYTPIFPTAIPTSTNWRDHAEVVTLCEAIGERVAVLLPSRATVIPAAPGTPPANGTICRRSWLEDLQKVFTQEEIYEGLLDPAADSSNDYNSIAAAAVLAGMEPFEYFCKEIAGLVDPADATKWGFRYSNTLNESGNRVVQYPSSTRMVAEGDYLHPCNTEDLILAAKKLTVFKMTCEWQWVADWPYTTPGISLREFEKSTYEDTNFNGSLHAFLSDLAGEATDPLIEPITSNDGDTPGSYLKFDARYEMLETSNTALGHFEMWNQGGNLGFIPPYPGTTSFNFRVAQLGDLFLNWWDWGFNHDGWHDVSLGWHEIGASTMPAPTGYVASAKIGGPSYSVNMADFNFTLDAPVITAEDAVGEVIRDAPPFYAVLEIPSVSVGSLDITQNPAVTVDWTIVTSEGGPTEGQGNPFIVEGLYDGTDIYRTTYRATTKAFSEEDLQSNSATSTIELE